MFLVEKTSIESLNIHIHPEFVTTEFAYVDEYDGTDEVTKVQVAMHDIGIVQHITRILLA